MAESQVVIDQEGVQGTLLEREQQIGGPGLARIRLASGQTFLVPENLLSLDDDGYFHAPFRFADLHRQAGPALEAEHVVIPVGAEDLDVQRHTRETGRVRVTKTVHERSEVVDEPIFREEVQVERVPINRVLDEPVVSRYEGDMLVIPVMEEVFVVEKRLVLKEELHITKHRFEAHEPQQVTLRREEVSIERVEPDKTDQGVSK